MALKKKETKAECPAAGSAKSTLTSLGNMATALSNHIGDVNVGIHDFAEFPPVVSF